MDPEVLKKIQLLLDDIIITSDTQTADGLRIIACADALLKEFGLKSEYESDEDDSWMPEIYTQSEWGDFTEYVKNILSREN